MADYDVQALSLATPPQAAPVTTYRPAVRVRNNGIHPANVTGTCRQYRREPPGELLATWSLSLLNLPAGNEGDALADGYWIPTGVDIGRELLFIATVTTEHDQVESNNHLAPVTVLVTADEPPPPPEVQAHAPQHEAGGSDQVNVDGLHGQLSDDQPPDLHKTSHQAGGPDQLDVTGLSGVLGTLQPVELHGYHHQHDEDDEINVNELHGTLADNQPPAVHGNEAHDPPFLDTPACAAAVAEHDEKETAHEASTNLELLAHKGTPDGYPELDATGIVPAAQLGTGFEVPSRVLYQDGTWKNQNRLQASIDAAQHCIEGQSVTILSISDPLQPDGTVYVLDLMAWLYSTALRNNLTITVLAGTSGQALTAILTSSIPIGAGLLTRHAYLHAALQVLAGSIAAAGIETDNLDLVPRTTMPIPGVSAVGPAGIEIQVVMTLDIPATATDLWCTMAAIVRHGL